MLSGILTTGALGFVLLPPAGDALGLGAETLSCWVGVCMPSTAEAVLIGAAHSEEALRLTAGWRLLVNALQWVPHRHLPRGVAPRKSQSAGRVARGFAIAATTMRGIPLFVWGLAVVSGLGYSRYFDTSERKALGELTYWALLVALAGIGWNTRPRDFLRFGPRKIALLVGVWLMCVALLLAAILALR